MEQHESIHREGADSSLVYRDTILGYFNQDVEAAEESYRRFVHAKLVEEDSLEELVTYDDILGSNSFVSDCELCILLARQKEIVDPCSCRMMLVKAN